ncbi:MAG: hypothetical protein ACI8SC_001937 [Colwellia sp.]|jgi:hypothetical protein
MAMNNTSSKDKMNEEEEYSNISMVKETMSEESAMVFLCKYSKLEEEASLCFVLGYN